MKKALIGFLVASLASTALATIGHSVGPVDNNNNGKPTDFMYFTYDFKLALSQDDDWTSTSLTATIDSGDVATFNPRRASLKPPAVDDAPPTTWANRYGNMCSSPNDWPNTEQNAN